MPRDGVRGLQTNSLYRNVKTWNNLPKGVVHAKGINNFKEKLDEAWKDKPTKYNHIYARAIRRDTICFACEL